MIKQSIVPALALCGLVGIAVTGGVGSIANAQAQAEMDFQCESGNVITVRYGSGQDEEGVTLTYMGQEFDLYAVQSAGDRFATEQGLDPERGLNWQMDGDTWHLSEMILDHTAPDGDVLESCVASDPYLSAQASPSAELPVGTWQATSLLDVTLVPEHEPIATFNADGSINGNTGCNTFGGQAAPAGAGISISNTFMTRMGCEDERHAVERAFLDALEGTASFEIGGEVLTLVSEDGTMLATFDLLAPPSGNGEVGEEVAETSDAILFRNVRIFDGNSPQLSEISNVLVQGNLIAEISVDPIDVPTGATIIEGDGDTLMPGLIDAHWHAMLVGVPPDVNLSPGYFNLVAGVEAEATLMRGFTTVRDMGGASFDLKRAIDTGLIPGPRIYPSGAMITVTSGHGDFRTFADLPREIGKLVRMEELGMAMVADSPDEVRMGVREQLMQGAVHVKLTAGGGVASPFSPLDVSTFTLDELRAAVEAAENWGTYIAVHAYTPDAIQTSIEAGVRVIEHGHLMDAETAQMIADNDVWLGIQPFHELLGAGLPPESSEKFLTVLHATNHAYTLAKQYDIKMAFGTDILFSSLLAQAQGATLVQLERWFTPAEALQMATATNAELLLLTGNRNPYPGELGVVSEGAYADLLLVDGNPLENLALVADPEHNMLVIMKDGVIYKNIL
jgi:imidazolonepropionase-like amidohydrolase/heat shock protein HslJ